MIHKRVYLEDFPRIKKGIDWKNCINKTVKFEYRDITGELKILDYDIKNNKLKVLYKDRIDYISTDSLLSCKLGRILKVMTNEFKIEIGEEIIDDKRSLLILDREIRIGASNRRDKFYLCKCLKCGYEHWKVESHLLGGLGCPVCCTSPQVVVEGINDIPTTAPWMIPYFQGGYEEAKKYTKSSGKKIYPICPDCGRVRKSKVVISNIYKRHHCGCPCRDTKSYPEKFITNILDQLNINYETAFSNSNVDWCDKYKYDFYLKDQNIILEVNGMQHYKYTGFYKNAEEQQEIDQIKKDLALKNGISEYIELDCRYSDKNYIKESIIKSELKKLINIDNINWEKADKYATKNLVKEMCEYYEKHKRDMLIIEMCGKFNLSRGIFLKHLRKGNEYGWCNYKPAYNYDKNISYKKKQIKVVETGKIYRSITACAKDLNINQAGISKAVKLNQVYKNYHFEYIDKGVDCRMKVTCKKCKKKIEKKDSYCYIHTTKSGNVKKMYYCNRDEFHKEYMEKVYYNRARRRVDKILGYVCVSKQKNSMITNLYKAGYKRKDVLDCLIYYEDEIKKYMELKNIENEYHQLRYIFTIIENNIKDFSKINNYKKEIKKSIPEIEMYEELDNNYEIKIDNRPLVNRRRSLKDRLEAK